MSIRPDRFLRLAAPSLSLSLLLVACSGEIGDVGDDDDTTNPGTARLTIVGDRNVVLGLGETTTITVKYTDASGRPLAGAVGFAIVGRADGNTLSAAQGVTDPQGLANVNLTGGSTELTFNVRASADQAAAVEWQIALQGQNLPALAAVGSYELDSQFDLVSGIPGSTGDVVNTIIALTDGPNDPASYLLDQLGGTAEDIIDPLRPFVDVIMNQVILQNSPLLVTDLVAVGNAFGDVTKRFGLVSEITIAQRAGTQELVGTHRLLGLHFTVNGMRHEYTVAELGWGPIQATLVSVTMMPGGKLVIGDHALDVSYGSMMVFALNHIILPEVVPGVNSIGALLDRAVDCGAIGAEVSDAVGLGFFGAIAFEEGCRSLADEAGDAVEDEIRSVGGSASAIAIHGDAVARDTNGDQKVDRLTAGLWEGEYRLGPVNAALVKPMQKFTGQSMTGPVTP